MSHLIRDLLDDGATVEAVGSLLAQWGGLPLFVPRSPGPEHPIVAIAGPELARLLASRYGGERVNMPIGQAFRRELLRREVFALKRAGLNHVQIARRLSLHLRWVQRIASAGESPNGRPPGQAHEGD